MVQVIAIYIIIKSDKSPITKEVNTAENATNTKSRKTVDSSRTTGNIKSVKKYTTAKIDENTIPTVILRPYREEVPTIRQRLQELNERIQARRSERQGNEQIESTNFERINLWDEQMGHGSDEQW